MSEAARRAKAALEAVKGIPTQALKDGAVRDLLQALDVALLNAVHHVDCPRDRPSMPVARMREALKRAGWRK